MHAARRRSRSSARHSRLTCSSGRNSGPRSCTHLRGVRTDGGDHQCAEPHAERSLQGAPVDRAWRLVGREFLDTAPRLLTFKKGRHLSLYGTANTQIAPPSGTSGYAPRVSVFSRLCMPRESMPQPDCTAMYCLPSMVYDAGGPMMPELVGNSHTRAPVAASNACSLRSLVPPLNTRPPPVASMDPQFADVG